jgi:hypothetical protein
MFFIVLIIMADRSFFAHLAKGNVSICHRLTSQKQELSVTVMFVNGSELNEQSL